MLARIVRAAVDAVGHLRRRWAGRMCPGGSAVAPTPSPSPSSSPASQPHIPGALPWRARRGRRRRRTAGRRAHRLERSRRAHGAAAAFHAPASIREAFPRVGGAKVVPPRRPTAAPAALGRAVGAGAGVLPQKAPLAAAQMRNADGGAWQLRRRRWARRDACAVAARTDVKRRHPSPPCSTATQPRCAVQRARHCSVLFTFGRSAAASASSAPVARCRQCTQQPLSRGRPSGAADSSAHPPNAQGAAARAKSIAGGV